MQGLKGVWGPGCVVLKRVIAGAKESTSSRRVIIVLLLVGLIPLALSLVFVIMGWSPRRSLGLIWSFITPVSVFATLLLCEIYVAVRRRRRLYRFRGRVCPSCGFDLRGVVHLPAASLYAAQSALGPRRTVVQCPECGRRVDLKRQLASEMGSGIRDNWRLPWMFRLIRRRGGGR